MISSRQEKGHSIFILKELRQTSLLNCLCSQEHRRIPLTYIKIILYTKARQKSARHFSRVLTQPDLNPHLLNIHTSLKRMYKTKRNKKTEPLQTDTLCFVSDVRWQGSSLDVWYKSRTSQQASACILETGGGRRNYIIIIHPCLPIILKKGDKALEPSESDLKGPSDTQQTNKSLASYNS